MDTITTLSTLLQLAQTERDAAAQALRQAESAARAAQAQSDQLIDYRGEYRQRWTARFQQSGTTLLLQCYHGFAERLDQAIAQQSHNTVQARSRLQRAERLLLAREQRVAAVGKLIERRRVAAQLLESRREQRQLDEAAARLGAAAHHAAPF